VRDGVRDLRDALAAYERADMLMLETPLDQETKGALFKASDAVLANSGREPFGLVGLETMAVGGLACTGATGEDYAIPGRNALVMQTDDPREFRGLFSAMRTHPTRERELRRHARTTARGYAWPLVIERNLLPRVSLARA
jgi:glycosyltransferase involved in cell wall biosynthesis